MRDAARALGAILLLALFVIVFTPWIAERIRRPQPGATTEPDAPTTSLEPIRAARAGSGGMAGIPNRLAERVGVPVHAVHECLVACGVVAPSGGCQPPPARWTEPAADAIALSPREGARRPTADDLREAIRHGLELARSQDDHGQCGLEYDHADGPEEYEVELLDQSLRDQAELAAKLSIAAREMLTRREFPGREEELVRIARELTWTVSQMQEDMRQRVTVRLDEMGSRQDRQLYDFQVGVINHLRRHGFLPELKALYRPGTTEAALDYPLEWALGTLRLKCPEFAQVEGMGIERLLAAPPQDLQHALHAALPPWSATNTPSAALPSSSRPDAS